MKILLSNDDGVHAKGLNTLKDVLSKEHEVFVCAPLEERSATGHFITLSHPVRPLEIEKNVWGLSGYPADCVMMALQEMYADIKFDVMISGINHGSNLGQEIYYSGTVAAAREASFSGLPSIAVSVVNDPPYKNYFHFESAALFIEKMLKEDAHKAIGRNEMLNVNVPNVLTEEILGAEVTKLGFRRYTRALEKRLDTRQRPYYWMGGHFDGDEDIEGSDTLCILEKKISVTRIEILSSSMKDTSDLKKILSNTFKEKR